ncbi:MAG: AAA family ATPase [Opitutales bacterium]|nr:AAA family ATPase [Opitutales bacterium]
MSTVSSARDTATTHRPLAEVLDEIKDGTHAAAVAAIRAESDPARRRELKRRLPAVLFAGTFSVRRNDALETPSGFLVLDFDDLDDAPGVRDRMGADPCVRAAFVSPSGNGVKALLPTGDRPYREAFAVAEEYLWSNYGLQADPSGKDPARLCFVSHDPDMVENAGATAPPDRRAPPDDAPSPPEHREKTYARTPEDVAEMLSYVRGRPGYDEWIRIIAAVSHAVGPDTAERLLCAWRPEEVEGEYREKLRHPLERVTVGTLVEIAKAHGWTPGPRGEDRAIGWTDSTQAGTYTFTASEPDTEDGAEDAGHWGVDALDLIETYPDYRPEVVAGLIREGEVCNIIAAPKTGKSWLVLDMALSVATGRAWLGRETCSAPVLMVDAELHGETLAQRLKSVTRALNIVLPRGGVIVKPMRGKAAPLVCLAHNIIAGAKRAGAKLIVIDALYRFWGEHQSENDNAAVTQVFNISDEIAEAAGAAVIVVHHSSKGNQAGKAVTDGGSGAGAISRAADTHVFLREHEEDGQIVMEAVTRSFAQPPPAVLHRTPANLWEIAEGADPARLAGAKTPNASDRIDDDKLLSFLRANHESREVIAARIDTAGLKFSTAKLRGRLDLLFTEGKVFTSKGPRGVALYGTAPAPDTDVGTRIAEAASRLPEATDSAIAAEVGCTDRAVRKWRAGRE